MAQPNCCVVNVWLQADMKWILFKPNCTTQWGIISVLPCFFFPEAFRTGFSLSESLKFPSAVPHPHPSTHCPVSLELCWLLLRRQRPSSVSSRLSQFVHHQVLVVSGERSCRGVALPVWTPHLCGADRSNCAADHQHRPAGMDWTGCVGVGVFVRVWWDP